MVAPSFLALTSTPSIAPSSLEDTSPVSAAAVCARAPPHINPAANRTPPRPKATPSQACFRRMGTSRRFLGGADYCAISPGVEAGEFNPQGLRTDVVRGSSPSRLAVAM